MQHDITLHLRKGHKEPGQKPLSIFCGRCAHDFTSGVGVQALIDTYHKTGTQQSWNTLLNLADTLGDCPKGDSL